MYKIQQMTTDASQTQNLILPDGSTVTLTIYFIPMQYGWFIQSLSYQDFVLQGVRLTNNPNILQPFKNQIPFGLACFSSSQREPTLQEDFSTGASSLYILTSEEVEEYAEFLSRG